MSRHSFDPEIAKQVGVNAAVIYQNLYYWVEKNAANGKNFREGRYWTYNSYPAFTKLFSYLSEKQIRTALKKLIDEGLILKGNFNEDRFTHTNWYSLAEPICPNGQNEATKRADNSAPKGGAPDLKGRTYKEDQIKTNNKPNKKAVLDWDFGDQFVPLGKRNVELTMWRYGLQDLGISQIERVFDLISRGKQEGYLIPAQLSPKNKSEREAFLDVWLKHHGKSGGLVHVL